MAKYLLVRLSAMGDVAMLLPIVYAVAQANPEHRFTFLTQPFLTSLLLNIPDNLEVMALDTKREERSLAGVIRYADRLRRERFDYFIDLHDVLRTKVLRLCTNIATPTRCVALRKPRAERKRLLNMRPRSFEGVPQMRSLYMDTLRKAGLCVPDEIAPISLSELPKIHHQVIAPFFDKAQSRILLGVAPTASTEAKTYDLSLMEEVVRELMYSGKYQVYLFGSRQEADLLRPWSKRYGAICLAGELELQDELCAMQRLDAMLSMDSANAHLAAMVGTRVVSIWCSTHPAAGFLAMGQNTEDCLQGEDMPCRPCSIFGKVDFCELGDMPCRRAIDPKSIVAHLDGTIG